MTESLALLAVLVILATYHVTIGVISVVSLRVTARLTKVLYGLELARDPQLAHAVRMLGLYALAIGAMLALAARAPEEHRDVIAVIAGLQLLRAASRLGYRRQLAAAFRLSPRRNAFNAVLLVGEAAVLLLCLPRG